MTIDFLFQCNDSGEQIFVELDTEDFDDFGDMIESAKEIASEQLSDPEYQGTVTAEEADFYGLDTY